MPEFLEDPLLNDLNTVGLVSIGDRTWSCGRSKFDGTPSLDMLPGTVVLRYIDLLSN